MADKEYIERNALIERMEAKSRQLRADYGSYDAYTNGFDEGLVAVEDAVAADVVEVRRGEWIRDEWSCFYTRYNCSVCGCGCMRIGEPTNFCPNCGADMRGKGKSDGKI